MNLTIYNSSNNDALLKSLGPFKKNIADDSFSGFQCPQNIPISSPIIIGEVSIIGETLIIGSKKSMSI